MNVVAPVRRITRTRTERDIEVAAVGVGESHLFGRGTKLFDGVEPFAHSLGMQEPVAAPFGELAAVQFPSLVAGEMPEM